MKVSIFSDRKSYFLTMLIGYISACAPIVESPSKTNGEIVSNTIFVRQSQYKTEIHIDENVRGKLQGTVVGVGGGAGTGVGFCSSFGATGEPVGVFLAIYCLPFGVVIGGIVGGVTGAVNAESIDVLESKEEQMYRKLSHATQEQASSYALEYLGAYDVDVQNYPSKSPVLNSNVLEISITDIVLTSPGFKNTRMTLEVRAKATLTDASTGKESKQIQLKYFTVARKFSQWGKDNFSLLKDEIENSYRYIVEQVIDDMILNYHHHEEKVEEAVKVERVEHPTDIQSSLSLMSNNFKHGSPEVSKKSGVMKEFISLIYPEESPFVGTIFGPKKIKEDHPVFKWKALPTSFNPIKHTLKDISYELRIYEAQKITGYLWQPTKLIYERKNIPEPQHQIDEELELCGFYQWSVRAKFKLNDHTRLTEWTGRHYNGARPWQTRRNDGDADTVMSNLMPILNFFEFEADNCPPDKQPENKTINTIPFN